MDNDSVAGRRPFARVTLTRRQDVADRMQLPDDRVRLTSMSSEQLLKGNDEKENPGAGSFDLKLCYREGLHGCPGAGVCIA